MTISDKTIRPITHKEAKLLITEYHYLGDKGFRGGYSYGLFDETDTLVGVAIYQPVSAPETVVGCLGLERNEQEGILELSRFVLRPDMNGKNYGSWFLSKTLRALKKIKIKFVISYASSNLHNGALYIASNFKYYGLSDPRNDFYIVDSTGKLVKQERGKTKGVTGVWVARPPKHRYIYVLNGNKRQIKWIEQPYNKLRPEQSSCYGCNGTGKVYDKRLRDNILEYNCPICND